MNHNHYLLLGGMIHLIIALILAWCLVGVLYLRLKPLVRLFSSSRELIRAHIDFLLMSFLLMLFWIISHLMGIALPHLLTVLLLFGTFFNAAGFLVLAVKPEMEKYAFSYSGIFYTIVFVCTTSGCIWFIFLVWNKIPN